MAQRLDEKLIMAVIKGNSCRRPSLATPSIPTKHEMYFKHNLSSCFGSSAAFMFLKSYGIKEVIKNAKNNFSGRLFFSFYLEKNALNVLKLTFLTRFLEKIKYIPALSFLKLNLKAIPIIC